MGYNYHSVYFEDVRAGQDLPALRLPITVRSIIMAASASRDWQPQHHDRDFCQQNNKRDIFTGTWWYVGTLTRYLTDWAGPESFVSNLTYKINKSIYPGDDVKIDGKITGLRVEGDQHIVELDLLVSNQLGPATPASARVLLPSKA